MARDDAVRVEGWNVVLRDPGVRDLGSLAHWLTPGQQWEELDGPYYPKATTQQVERMLSALRVRIDAGDFPAPRQTMVIADRATDTLLGRVSWYWESEETAWLCLGIVLYDPKTWGRGLGHEAFGLWADYLLRAMPQLVRLDLRTWSGNHGMMRLAEKLGFTLEARFRKARIVDGAYYDGLGYGVLREEWEARYPGGFAKSLAPL
jgi:putative hydrolase of HD superfamily